MFAVLFFPFANTEKAFGNFENYIKFCESKNQRIVSDASPVFTEKKKAKKNKV